MAAVRCGLRRWVVVCLLLQAAALGALLPRDCCKAHEHDTSRASSCHDARTAVQCPMRGPDGAACPMHRDDAATNQIGTSDCALRGSCSGPMSGMVALLSQVGVMPSSTAPAVDTGDTALVLACVLEPERRGTPPDSPPPRG
jgi:hypothetical protein